MPLDADDLYHVHAEALAPAQLLERAAVLLILEAQHMQPLVEPFNRVVGAEPLKLALVEIREEARLHGEVSRGEPAGAVYKQHRREDQRQQPQTSDTGDGVCGDERDDNDDEHAYGGQRHQRQTEVAVLDPQRCKLRGLHVEHRADEYRHADVDHCEAYELFKPRLKPQLAEQRQQHETADERDAEHHNAVEGRHLDVAPQICRPVAVLFLARLLLVGVSGELLRKP